MTDESLEAEIGDGRRLRTPDGDVGGRITVRIDADAGREEDFNKVREAVKEVLDGNE